MDPVNNTQKIVLVAIVACVIVFAFFYLQKPEESTTVAATEVTADEMIQPLQKIHEVHSRADLDALLAHTDKPVVVKFFATWCPPCRALKPLYSASADEFATQAHFAEIDIDGFDDKAYLETFNVQTIPTILFFKEGSEKKRIQGLRNKAQLKEELASL